MADTLTTLSLVTLAQGYRGDVVRQINRRTVFLKLVRIIAGEGKNAAWAPEGNGMVAESYSEGADASNFGSDSQASAMLNWGLYRANFHVSQLAMDGAATTATPEGNKGLWARNLVNATTGLASFLNAECYGGTGSGTIAGLGVAIGQTTNVYAGIDRSQAGNAYFRPIVTDPGAPTSITLALVRDDIRKNYEAAGENPDIALCSPTLLNSAAGMFDATRRIVQSAVVTARGNITLDAGYQAVEIEGVMFMKDKDATAGSIFYVNTNHLHLEYLPGKLTSAIEQAGVQADDGFGAVPLGMTYEMLAKTGAAEKAEVRFTGQLICDRPNSCGVRLNAK